MKKFVYNNFKIKKKLKILDDESIVSIFSKELESESSISNYINASKIHDDDPRQVAYIATQAPLQNTVIDYWKMVWEQGIALIVNLCDYEDEKSQKYIKYWPEEGSKVYGIFEVIFYYKKSLNISLNYQKRKSEICNEYFYIYISLDISCFGTHLE